MLPLASSNEDHGEILCNSAVMSLSMAPGDNLLLAASVRNTYLAGASVSFIGLGNFEPCLVQCPDRSIAWEETYLAGQDMESYSPGRAQMHDPQSGYIHG